MYIKYNAVLRGAFEGAKKEAYEIFSELCGTNM